MKHPSHGNKPSKGKTSHSSKNNSGSKPVTIVVPGVGEPVSCSGAAQPTSPPFLESPYHGYTSINSYFDHDLPDYAIDGKIILANGLVASGIPSSYSWPAYYSPVLREYVNYDGHNGYDFGISYQPVYAAAAGKVLYAAWESADPYVGYGQMILIAHKDGYETLYGHLSKLMVKPGQVVKAGQQIGISGTTGHSTGPHLHFSVYHNCHVVDPYGWGGTGPDPLLKFNGEQSTYLWLNGDSPSVLNPLGNWPTYATMVKGSQPTIQTQPVTGASHLVHLLLLKLPAFVNEDPSALTAMVQVQMQQEEDQLVPLLQALEKRGSLRSFEVLRNVAAIEVTGSAPAGELLGLPGVAAITGASATDILNADRGYSAALTGALPDVVTPPLFPSTYLDAASMAHISLTAEENGSYVYGFAPKGARVSIAVTRGGAQIGHGTAAADTQRGAFVGIVTDQSGQNLRILPGDVVEAQSAGATTSVSVVPLTLTPDAATNMVSGSAPVGADLSLSVKESLTGRTLHYGVNEPSSGPRVVGFRLRVAGKLAPGDPISMSLVEASGNSLFRWTNVPGFRLAEGSSFVQGWQRSWSKWRAAVFVHHRMVASGHGMTALNGALEIMLHGPKSHAFVLQPTQHLRLTSRGGAVLWVRVPTVTVSGVAGGKYLKGVGPRRAHIFAQIWNGSTGSQVSVVTTASRSGFYRAMLPNRAGPGSTFAVMVSGAAGTVFAAGSSERGLTIHPNSGLLYGSAAPDQILVVSVLNLKHRTVGRSITATTAGGTFVTSVFGRKGHLQLRAGYTVTVFDGRTTSSYVVRDLIVRARSGPSLQVWTTSGRTLNVALWTSSKLDRNISARVVRNQVNVSLAGVDLGPGGAARITLGTPASGAIEIDIPLTSAGSLGVGAANLAQSLSSAMSAGSSAFGPGPVARNHTQGRSIPPQ